MITRLLALTILLSFPAFAQDDCSPTVIDPSVVQNLNRVASRLNVQCPRTVNVANLCMAVSRQTTQRDTNLQTRYAYQNQILNAACVEPGDSAAVKRGKVQAFWNRFHQQINCSQLGFRAQNGSILKLAVQFNAMQFAEEAVLDWQLNLNHIDSSDRKTVLDFIQSELRSAAGSPRERVLREYYELFRSNGAKLSSEL